MKKIGIIGGMSSVSSAHYYERINNGVKERLGNIDQTTPTIIMYSVNFGEIEPLMVEGKWDEIALKMIDIARKLESIGVDFIVIATNTIHKLFDVIESNINIPVIHIADSVSKKCNEEGIKDVGLLGTAYTMREEFLKDRLKKNGLNVIVPDEDRIDELNRIIFEELCHDKVISKSKEYYKEIIDELSLKYGAKGIILGCTEIEMLIKKNDVSVPIFDTTEAHINDIVDYVTPKKLVK